MQRVWQTARRAGRTKRRTRDEHATKRAQKAHPNVLFVAAGDLQFHCLALAGIRVLAVVAFPVVIVRVVPRLQYEQAKRNKQQEEWIGLLCAQREQRKQAVCQLSK
jgi:precorrin-3B methylase